MSFYNQLILDDDEEMDESETVEEEEIENPDEPETENADTENEQDKPKDESRVKKLNIPTIEEIIKKVKQKKREKIDKKAIVPENKPKKFKLIR